MQIISTWSQRISLTVLPRPEFVLLLVLCIKRTLQKFYAFFSSSEYPEQPMANKELPSEKGPLSKSSSDIESVVRNGMRNPAEGKLVRQLKNRHITMIR